MGPTSFRELRVEDRVLVVDPSLESAARAADLLEPERMEQILAEGSGSEGRRGTSVITLPGASERVLLRAVVHGGWLGPLLGGALMGLRRPLAELEVSAALREAGAPVARPALVVGRRLAGPLWKAWMGTVFEEETQDALALLSSGPGRDRILQAAKATGRAVRRFHDAGGRHPDLHLKNVILRESGSSTEALLVDLDRAAHVARVSPGARMAELMRLYRSLLKRRVLDQVGPEGCAACFRAYVAGDLELRRALLRHLTHERLKVAIHALGYPRN